jgi:hypothetical protein
LWQVPVDEVWPRVEMFAAKHLEKILVRSGAAGKSPFGLQT